MQPSSLTFTVLFIALDAEARSPPDLPPTSSRSPCAGRSPRATTRCRPCARCWSRTGPHTVHCSHCALALRAQLTPCTACATGRGRAVRAVPLGGRIPHAALLRVRRRRLHRARAAAAALAAAPTFAAVPRPHRLRARQLAPPRATHSALLPSSSLQGPHTVPRSHCALAAAALQQHLRAAPF